MPTIFASFFSRSLSSIEPAKRQATATSSANGKSGVNKCDLRARCCGVLTMRRHKFSLRERALAGQIAPLSGFWSRRRRRRRRRHDCVRALTLVGATPAARIVVFLRVYKCHISISSQYADYRLSIDNRGRRSSHKRRRLFGALQSLLAVSSGKSSRTFAFVGAKRRL